MYSAAVTSYFRFYKRKRYFLILKIKFPIISIQRIPLRDFLETVCKILAFYGTRVFITISQTNPLEPVMSIWSLPYIFKPYLL